MTQLHHDLTPQRWHQLSFFSQMANIGAEVGRTATWREKNTDWSQAAALRALELLDLTLEDSKNHTSSRLKELWRLREVMADSLFFDNEYGSTDLAWQHYFDAFAYAASLERL